MRSSPNSSGLKLRVVINIRSLIFALSRFQSLCYSYSGAKGRLGLVAKESWYVAVLFVLLLSQVEICSQLINAPSFQYNSLDPDIVDSNTFIQVEVTILNF